MYESFDYSATMHTIPAISEWLVYPPTVSPAVPRLPIEVVKLINAFRDYWLNLLWLNLLKMANMIYVSDRFSRLFEDLRPLLEHVIVNIDLYLRSTGIYASKYVLDVYDLGEEGYSEARPFVEVHINVEDVDEMLSVWENVIEFLEARLGDEVLDYIDIFFTRAR